MQYNTKIEHSPFTLCHEKNESENETKGIYRERAKQVSVIISKLLAGTDIYWTYALQVHSKIALGETPVYAWTLIFCSQLSVEERFK